MIDPPRDHSVHDMSWVGPAASLHQPVVAGPDATRRPGRLPKRQMAVALNLRRWNRLDPAGRPRPHPIDDALVTLYGVAMYG